MKSVFDRFFSLWPQDARARLKPLLANVYVLVLPEDRALINKMAERSAVLVVHDIRLRDIMTLVEMGFDHIVQADRPDFARELLASALMTVKPTSFFNNPLPFFLNGFESSALEADPDRQLIMRFSKRSEKDMLLEWLGVFLNRKRKIASIRELCIQCADEMISNALFNAPIVQRGKRAYKDLPRETDIQLPSSMAATLFACITEEGVVIGCKDAYGSLDRQTLLHHMREMFNDGGAVFKTSVGGAGLGVRYLIENSANFYTLVDPGKFTLMACGFVLKGLKANVTTPKHFHMSFNSTGVSG